MTDDRGAIENLLARYCELFDSGDMDGYVALFTEASMANQFVTSEGPEAIRSFFEENGLFYEGLPHTRHVISNIHIEVADDGRAASARSYVTVFQALADFPLQPIFIGQYQDELVKVDDAWRFQTRACEPYLAGDLSRHARQYPPAGPVVVEP